MTAYRPGRCDMCLRDKELRHVNIYINGSEGTFLCHSCYMELVEIVSERKRASFKKKMEDYIANKKKADYTCPKCGHLELPSIYGNTCTKCGNEKRGYYGTVYNNNP